MDVKTQQEAKKSSTKPQNTLFTISMEKSKLYQRRIMKNKNHRHFNAQIEKEITKEERISENVEKIDEIMNEKHDLKSKAQNRANGDRCLFIPKGDVGEKK